MFVALIYRAQLSPTKAELLAAWLPSRPWSPAASSGPYDLLGAYRFDDPAGQVGIETHLVRTAGGDVLHVPLTYRAAPLDGADGAMVATMEHSHLGHRWVYDGCGDPVYAAALAAAILAGGRQAEQWVEADGGHERRELATHVTGSGTPGAAIPVIDTVRSADDPVVTTIDASGCRLVVLRVVGAARRPAGVETLTCTWPGRAEPALLAFARC